MNETLYNYDTEKRELLVRLEHYCAFYNQVIQEWSLSECTLQKFTESILNPENIELTCTCVSLQNFVSIGSVPNNFITNDIIRSFEVGIGAGLTLYTWDTFKHTIYWKQLFGLFMVWVIGVLMFLVSDLCFTYHLEKTVLNKKFMEFIQLVQDELAVNLGDAQIDDKIFNLRTEPGKGENLLGIKKKKEWKDVKVARKKANQGMGSEDAQEEYKNARTQIFRIPKEYMKNVSLRGQAKRVIEEQLLEQNKKDVMDRKLLFRNISYINKDFLKYQGLINEHDS